ncbi:MAG: hypothetical protein J0J01_12330 [Reyranella sp.]|uniref:hypothetical protein n=1 Tax=Reyranella sp. TaxID=1929291 RepID=UPI001AD11CA3|nr:hypothetical protein [Reyranella sp.]MBN9087688.1 hypothetical protein [Reyranella sp.]
MLRLAIASLLLPALSLPASANWTRAQREQFLGQCVESCQSTLKLPDSKRRVCDATCGCVADQAETQVTPADMYALDEAAAAGRTTETMQKIRGFFPACAKRAARMP